MSPRLFAEGGVRGEAPRFGDDGGLDGPRQARLGQVPEYLLHFPGAVWEPTGLAGSEQQLLFLKFKSENVQKFTLPPQQG